LSSVPLPPALAFACALPFLLASALTAFPWPFAAALMIAPFPLPPGVERASAEILSP
jgi:hypothetical protein